MPEAVGVRFRGGPKLFYFDPAGLTLHRGTLVLAHGVWGLEIGQVVLEPQDFPPERLPSPLKPILRIATPEDLRQEEENRLLEEKARKLFLERVRARNMPMKLIEVNYTFDRNQVTFYFTADDRLDFRELVRDLAAVLKTRIMLYQITERDAAQRLGGFGPCGQQLCCSRFLEDPPNVAIRMAKDQSLFLNPSKFSGLCGKLMCCLRFEHQLYLEARNSMPALGSAIQTPYGQGFVEEINVIRQTIVVHVPGRGRLTLPWFPSSQDPSSPGASSFYCGDKNCCPNSGAHCAHCPMNPS